MSSAYTSDSKLFYLKAHLTRNKNDSGTSNSEYRISSNLRVFYHNVKTENKHDNFTMIFWHLSYCIVYIIFYLYSYRNAVLNTTERIVNTHTSAATSSRNHVGLLVNQEVCLEKIIRAFKYHQKFT